MGVMVIDVVARIRKQKKPRQFTAFSDVGEKRFALFKRRVVEKCLEELFTHLFIVWICVSGACRFAHLFHHYFVHFFKLV